MSVLSVDMEKDIVRFSCFFADKERAKKIGGVWNQSLKTWDFPFDLGSVEKILTEFPQASVPADFEQLLEQKKKLLEDIEVIKKEAKEDKQIIYKVPGIKLALYNYQKHGVRLGSIAPNGFLLADEMGLGKSIQGIGIAMTLKKKKNIKNCLIVCPASVKHNWLNEVKKFTDETAIVVEGEINERFEKWFDTNSFFKIVNYEIFTRDLLYFEQEKVDKDGNIKKSKDTRIPDADKLLNGYFEVTILDEIHYLKTHKSLRTRALKKIKTGKKIGLTGTPLDGRLEELHSIFSFLVPGLFASKTKFLERHAKYNYFGGIEGYVKVDEVRDRIDAYYIRRLKKDVLKELPDKIFKDVFVILNKKAKKIYDEIASRKHAITEEKEAIVAVVRCRQFCDMPEILDIDMESDKLIALKELLVEIVDQNKQKVIIFSQYEKATRILFKELSKIYKVSYFYGGTLHKERTQICIDFNTDPTKQIIIMTDAGSVGINLQAASYVIHYDTNYSPSVMLQRTDRAHRIGQKNTVTVIRMICEDTIEQRVLEIMDEKMKVNDSVLDEHMSEMALGKISTRDLLSCL